jgi:hypothetical protein
MPFKKLANSHFIAACPVMYYQFIVGLMVYFERHFWQRLKKNPSVYGILK